MGLSSRVRPTRQKWGVPSYGLCTWQPAARLWDCSRQQARGREQSVWLSVENLVLESLMARYPQAVLSEWRLSVSARGEGLLQELWPKRQFGPDPNSGDTCSPKQEIYLEIVRSSKEWQCEIDVWWEDTKGTFSEAEVRGTFRGKEATCKPLWNKGRW